MPEIDLHQHPLTEFFHQICREYDRGIKKHGPWDRLSNSEQRKAVRDEFYEWIFAPGIDGEHGELAELPQLANVAGRRWLEVKKRNAATLLETDSQGENMVSDLQQTHHAPDR